ncbi:PilX N-terminal domain-containing pilus assembly protein [uncultured Psychromonas sp.]|uniref:pilus assembly PilX family protein n=1 Tax=uncultured Psychromonas sp. TaxID=173974 RepID=UPI00262EB03F|nr:PilX N-terminal domain-containing pilus assembly protein [uncultured Psychromonas sp.]
MNINKKSENGAALITSLLMVLVISILGVAVSQQVIASRKVSSASYDQNLSFNSAESTLATAHSVIAENFLDPPTLLSLAIDKNTTSNWWRTDANWNAAIALSSTISEGSVTPSYLIENDGTGGLAVGTGELSKRFYRVTVKAQGKGDSVAFLQSYYVTLE